MRKEFSELLLEKPSKKALALLAESPAEKDSLWTSVFSHNELPFAQKVLWLAFMARNHVAVEWINDDVRNFLWVEPDTSGWSTLSKEQRKMVRKEMAFVIDALLSSASPEDVEGFDAPARLESFAYPFMSEMIFLFSRTEMEEEDFHRLLPLLAKSKLKNFWIGPATFSEMWERCPLLAACSIPSPTARLEKKWLSEKKNLVEGMVKLGFPFRVRTGERKTPLLTLLCDWRHRMCPKKAGAKELLTLFLNEGANPKEVDALGISALCSANGTENQREASFEMAGDLTLAKEQEDIIRCLLSAGVEAELIRPIPCAIEDVAASPEIARLLVSKREAEIFGAAAKKVRRKISKDKKL